jgi:hypothetical protein
VYIGDDDCDDVLTRSCAPISVVIGSNVDQRLSHLQSHDSAWGPIDAGNDVSLSALTGVQVDTVIVGEHACDCQPSALLLPSSLRDGLHRQRTKSIAAAATRRIWGRELHDMELEAALQKAGNLSSGTGRSSGLSAGSQDSDGFNCSIAVGAGSCNALPVTTESRDSLRRWNDGELRRKGDRDKNASSQGTCLHLAHSMTLEVTSARDTASRRTSRLELRRRSRNNEQTHLARAAPAQNNSIHVGMNRRKGYLDPSLHRFIWRRHSIGHRETVEIDSVKSTQLLVEQELLIDVRLSDDGGISRMRIC